MNFRIKKLFLAAFSLIIVLLLASCSQTVEPASDVTSAESGNESGFSETEVKSDDMFTDRDLQADYDKSSAISIELADGKSTCSDSAVTVNNDTITVGKEGVYVLSGSLTNGQIIVDSDKKAKIQLVLNGVNINCNTSAAIYVKQADKVFITLDENTENTLSNKDDFVQIDDNNIDSVIFSKDDLTLNGTGSLTVNAVYGHGVVSKDDLVLAGGSYNITAASHALSGKDDVKIAGGSYTLSSGKDGIHSENTDDPSLGFIYIANGNFNITAEGDAMDASGYLQINDGKIEVTAGGGSENAETVKTEMFGVRGGMMNPQNQVQQTTDESNDSTSVKGLKADGGIIFCGGTIIVDSADDAVHSNANTYVKGGNLTLSTGDDGIHSDETSEVSGGKINILTSYEGIEGLNVNITGGEISIVASDDGVNAAGGNDQSGFSGGMHQDRFGSASNNEINISGGVLKVNASGDGLDSNGNLYVSGGEIYIDGPTDNGNSALDSDGEAQISNGTVVAVGSSGMAENFSSNSTQCVIMYGVSNMQASGEVTLKDSSGNTILSYTPSKTYDCVILSSPQIEKGKTYTLTAGGETTDIEVTGVITNTGNLSGGMMGMDPGMNHGMDPGMNPQGRNPRKPNNRFAP